MKFTSENEEIRVYTESEKKEVRDQSIRMGVVLVALLLLLVFANYLNHIAAAESEMPHSPVQEILSAYGSADDQSIQAMDTHYESTKPVHMDCEGLDISIEEVLYDGVWAYSTVYVQPQKGQSITVVPGGADLSDEIAISTDGESLSFLDLAEQNENRLLAVYCYPKEFDSQGLYFMDHVEDVNGAFYLVSGCEIPLQEDTNPLTMMLEVYEVDPNTLHYERAAQKELSPETYSPFSPVKKYEYHTVEDSDLFETVTLLKTGITSYLYVNWKNEDDAETMDAVPLTENMELIPAGYSLDAHAVYLEEIPEVLNIQISDGIDLTIPVRLTEGGTENE